MAYDYKLEHFEAKKILGEGNFGIVLLVTHKQTKKNYALKCVSKKTILKSKL